MDVVLLNQFYLKISRPPCEKICPPWHFLLAAGLFPDRKSGIYEQWVKLFNVLISKLQNFGLQTKAKLLFLDNM